MKEPKFKRVNKNEFINFINNYPRKLETDISLISEPPTMTYNDFSLEYSIVAVTRFYDFDNISEEDRYYLILDESEKIYTITELIKENE